MSCIYRIGLSCNSLRNYEMLQRQPQFHGRAASPVTGAFGCKPHVAQIVSPLHCTIAGSRHQQVMGKSGLQRSNSAGLPCRPSAVATDVQTSTVQTSTVQTSKSPPSLDSMSDLQLGAHWNAYVTGFQKSQYVEHAFWISDDMVCDHAGAVCAGVNGWMCEFKQSLQSSSSCVYLLLGKETINHW
jgi:hypothetical protein